MDEPDCLACTHPWDRHFSNGLCSQMVTRSETGAKIKFSCTCKGYVPMPSKTAEKRAE